MSSLEELYSLLLQQSTETAQQATAAILDVYKDPSNIDSVIQCLATGSSKFVKIQAAIGVKRMILSNINEYLASGKIEELKTIILQVLENEADPSIRHNIIQICDALFVENKNSSWPELLEYAGSLLGEGSGVEQQEVALKIYAIIIPNLSAAEINNFLSHLCEIITVGLNSSSEDLIVASAELTSLLTIIFEAPVPDEVMTCFQTMCQIFSGMLKAESDYAYKVAGQLANATDPKSCIEPNFMLDILMEIANDEEIPDSFVFHVFSPLSALIENHFSDISERIEDIVTVMITSASKAYTDDCASQQMDVFVICETMDKLIRESDPDTLFDSIVANLPEETPGQIYADIYFIQLFIKEAEETAASHIPYITEFLLKHISDEQEHGILELIFECLHSYIKVVNAGLADYGDDILNAAVSSIQSDHEPLIIAAFNMMSEYFITIPRDYSDIGDILQIIVHVANENEPDIQERALYCLYTLIFAAGEAVSPYASDILPMFKSALEISPETQPRMRSTGLLGIAMLHKTVPEMMLPVLPETLAILSESLQSEDLSLINSAMTSSMIIAEGSPEPAAELLQMSLAIAIQLIDKEIPQGNFDEEEEEFTIGEESEEVRELIEAKLNAIDLIRTCTKTKPDLIAPIAPELPDKLISLVLSLDSDVISSTACKCLGIVTLAFQLDANEVLAQLNEGFDRPIETVTAIFSLAKLFIKKGVDLGQTQINVVVENAQLAFKHNLECQSDEEPDFELLDQAYKFMALLAVNMPDFFPKDNFIGESRKAMKKHEEEELVFRTLVLGDFYAAHHDALEPLERTVILQAVFNATTMCNGYLPPYPLVAAAMILDSDPEAAGDYAQMAFEACGQIYEMEDQKQTYLHETYAACAAFCLVLVKQTGGSFDVSPLIAGIVNSFPIKDRKIARIAYPTLSICYQNFTALFEGVISELCIALGKFFALTDIEFKEIKLDNESIVAAANVLRHILQNAEGAQQVIDEQLGNEAAIARYKQRLQHFQ